MIALVAVGDRVRPGRYALRARFRRAADFHGPGGWLAAAEESLGRGPIRISLGGGLPARLRTVTVAREGLFLDGDFFPAAAAPLYRSGLDVAAGSAERLRVSEGALEEALLRGARPESLAFLVDPRRRGALRSGFESAYAERMMEGWRRIRSGRIGEGAALLRGCGFGLTPSGDDFLVGLLLSLRLREILGDGMAAALRSEARAALDPPGESLSEAYLALAGEGFFPERLKDLAGAMAEEGRTETALRTEALLASGATSGADTAAGVLLGLRLGRRAGKEERKG